MEMLLRRIVCDKCKKQEELPIRDSLLKRTIGTYELDCNGTTYKANLCPECKKKIGIALDHILIEYNMEVVTGEE